MKEVDEMSFVFIRTFSYILSNVESCHIGSHAEIKTGTSMADEHGTNRTKGAVVVGDFKWHTPSEPPDCGRGNSFSVANKCLLSVRAFPNSKSNYFWWL